MITFARLSIRGLILAFALAPFAAGCDDDSVDALEAIAMTIQSDSTKAPVRVTERPCPGTRKQSLDRYRVMGFIMAKGRYAQMIWATGWTRTYR